MSMRLAGQQHFPSMRMGSDRPKKKINSVEWFCLKERHTKVLREGGEGTVLINDSPMRPIILGSGVELLSNPSMVSYREWEIRRSWLSSREFTGCSKTGGLPGASYRYRERDQEESTDIYSNFINCFNALQHYYYCTYSIKKTWTYMLFCILVYPFWACPFRRMSPFETG